MIAGRSLKRCLHCARTMGNNVRCMKIYGLLGLAARKGSVTSGSEACLHAIKNNAVGLLILAGDSAHNTRERFIRLSGDIGMGHIVFGSCSELGRRIGKEDRSVLLVTDNNLAHGIYTLLGIADGEKTGV